MSWHGYASNPASLETSFAAGTGAQRFVRPLVRSALGRWAKGVLRSRGKMALRSAASARTASATLLSQRRRRRPDSQIIKGAQGGPSTSSQWKYGYPLTKTVKYVKTAANPQYYVSNIAWQLICTQGFQGVDNVFWGGKADLMYMLNKIPAATVGSATAKADGTKRYVLNSTQGELLITNSSLATAFVEIYDICRKRDAAASIGSSEPKEAWNVGVTKAEDGGSTGGGGTMYDITSSPFDSDLFKAYFTVVKRTRVEMAQGGLHRHSVNIRNNLLVDGMLLDGSSGDLAGYSHYTMIVVKGQPASATSGDSTVVTTAQIALDVVASNRYNFSFVDATATSHYTLDNLSSLADEKVVSAGAGTFVTNEIV